MVKEESGERDWIVPLIFGVLCAIAFWRWRNEGGLILALFTILFGLGMFSTLKLGIDSLKNRLKKKPKKEE